jgi:dienelactone hydrolase
VISDIFGATSGRHESVADTFAEFGYTVYIPEVLVNPYQGTGDIMQCIKDQSW